MFHPSIYGPDKGPFPALGSRDPKLYCSVLHRIVCSIVMWLQSAARGKQWTYFCTPLQHVRAPDLCVAFGFASVQIQTSLHLYTEETRSQILFSSSIAFYVGYFPFRAAFCPVSNPKLCLDQNGLQRSGLGCCDKIAQGASNGQSFPRGRCAALSCCRIAGKEAGLLPKRASLVHSLPCSSSIWW